MNNISADPEPKYTLNDDRATLCEYITYHFFLRKANIYTDMPIVYHVPRQRHIQQLSKSVMVLNVGRITSPACIDKDNFNNLVIYPDGWTVATIFNGKVVVITLNIIFGVVAYKCASFDQNGQFVKESHYYTSPLTAIQEALHESIAFSYPQHPLHAVAGVGAMCERTNSKLVEYFANINNKDLISNTSGYNYLYFTHALNSASAMLAQRSLFQQQMEHAKVSPPIPPSSPIMIRKNVWWG